MLTYTRTDAVIAGLGFCGDCGDTTGPRRPRDGGCRPTASDLNLISTLACSELTTDCFFCASEAVRSRRSLEEPSALTSADLGAGLLSSATCLGSQETVQFAQLLSNSCTACLFHEIKLAMSAKAAHLFGCFIHRCNRRIGYQGETCHELMRVIASIKAGLCNNNNHAP